MERKEIPTFFVLEALFLVFCSEMGGLLSVEARDRCALFEVKECFFLPRA